MGWGGVNGQSQPHASQEATAAMVRVTCGDKC